MEATAVAFLKRSRRAGELQRKLQAMWGDGFLRGLMKAAPEEYWRSPDLAYQHIMELRHTNRRAYESEPVQAALSVLAEARVLLDAADTSRIPEHDEHRYNRAAELADDFNSSFAADAAVSAPPSRSTRSAGDDARARLRQAMQMRHSDPEIYNSEEYQRQLQEIAAAIPDMET